MWIETREVTIAQPLCGNSFASNGECGLKQPIDNALPAACFFSFGSDGHRDLHPFPARRSSDLCYNSFASNGECGLKHCLRLPENHITPNSFASNGECGLKHAAPPVALAMALIHSPAMANVD